MANSEAAAAQNADDGDNMSPFLRLPRELRDKIYGLVWGEDKTIVVHKYGWPFVVQYKPDGNPERIYPEEVRELWRGRFEYDITLKGSGWLFTNKQLLEEGLEAFQRKAHWSSVPCEGVASHPDGFLLTPYTGRFWALEFYVRYQTKPVKIDLDEGACMCPGYWSFSRIENITRSGLGDVHLQQLELRLLVNHTFTHHNSQPNAGVPMVADFSMLEKFHLIAEVRKLHIVLGGVRLSRSECQLAGHKIPLLETRIYGFLPLKWQYADEDSLTLLFYHALKEEVLRVGKVIISEGDIRVSIKVTEAHQLYKGLRDVTFTFEIKGPSNL